MAHRTLTLGTLALAFTGLGLQRFDQWLARNAASIPLG